MMIPRLLWPLLAVLVLIAGAVLPGVGERAVSPVRQSMADRPVTWPLTEPGCCPGSRWAADSQRVFFYHRPDERRAGLWTVDLDGQMTFLQSRFGYLSADEQVLVSATGDNRTVIERLDTGTSLVLPNGGVETLLSPDGRLVAYFFRVRAGTRNSESLEQVMIAPLDGGSPLSLFELARADHLRWLPDSRHLLVFGWRPDGTTPGLWVANVDTGDVKQIVSGNFLTALTISPDGQWIAYLATLQPNAADNGVWVVRPNGADRRRLPYERAVHWAPDSQALLALVPVPGGKEIHRIDLNSGERTVLVSHAEVDFDVEADDWSIAPDGRHILYRSLRDRALWVIQIAP